MTQLGNAAGSAVREGAADSSLHAAAGSVTLARGPT